MNTAVAWAIFAALVYLVWKLWRYMRQSYRQYAQQKAEAFSAAVSSAVASGVAKAAAAAMADARAAATGGNVAVHIGDNLARLCADYDDVSPVYGLHNGPPTDAHGMGSVSDAARHGELASGRPIRPSTTRNPDRGNVRAITVEGGEIA